jgi:penicillin amidase
MVSSDDTDDSHDESTIPRRRVLQASAGVAGLGAVASQTTLSAPGGHEADVDVEVTVKRDQYGVPHVYARDAPDRTAVFFGFGYATAEDRLYQLELYRRYYHGTVAEVLGSDWVQFDREARRSTAPGAGLDEQLDEQIDDSQRAAIEAFADGINRYIQTVRDDDDRSFHGGFAENDFEPSAFDAVDVAGMYVASMAYFSGFQLETLGAAVVDGLTAATGSESDAMDLFGDLNWGNDPGAPTSSVQSEDGYVPPYTPAGENSPAPSSAATSPSTGASGDSPERGRTDVQHTPSNRITGGDYRIPTNPERVHETEMERVRTLATGLKDLGLPIKYGSNALAVQGDVTESGDALIMGGPQMGFSTPSVMYEAGLHGPNFDVAGITVAGYPFVMFGHNQNGAFTSTAGIDNCLQTFVESIDTSGDAATYEFQDESLPVEEETQTIPVAGDDDVEFTLRSTRHGVVTDWRPEAGEAIAQTQSYAGRHMNSWKAFFESQFAASTDAYVDAAQQCDYALNFMWAGKSGDIAYVHLGRYPDSEAVEWDTRLPADGTQHELTEEDYLRAADGEVPFSVNPPAGYSAQWNNKPAPEWNNGDLSYSWSTDHRVQRIINLTENRLATEGAVDYAFLKQVVYDLAFVDLRAIRFLDPLLDALDDADLSDREQAARAELEAWDLYGQGDGESFSGTYPAGYTVWNATFGNVTPELFADDFGDLYGPASYFLTYRYGRGTLMRALEPDATALDLRADYGNPDEAFVAAFRSAVATLDEENDGPPAEWGSAAAVDELDNPSLFGVPIGVGDAGDLPAMNRGTENHFVRLSDDPQAENVLPPGNSGYVTPDGTKSPHYDDQLELFVDFEYKDLLFADDAVEASTEATTTLTVDVATPATDSTRTTATGTVETTTADETTTEDETTTADEMMTGNGTTTVSDDTPGFGALVAGGAVGAATLARWLTRDNDDEGSDR